MPSASSRVDSPLRGRAQVGAHPRGELVEGERLGHVVDGAGVEAGDAVVDPGPRRQHDHGQPGLRRRAAREHVEPVAARQHAIEDHQREVLREARAAAPRSPSAATVTA